MLGAGQLPEGAGAPHLAPSTYGDGEGHSFAIMHRFAYKLEICKQNLDSNVSGFYKPTAPCTFDRANLTPTVTVCTT